MKRQRWRCCRKSVVCPLDNLAHALRIRWGWLCDRHETRIVG